MREIRDNVNVKRLRFLCLQRKGQHRWILRKLWTYTVLHRKYKLCVCPSSFPMSDAYNMQIFMCRSRVLCRLLQNSLECTRIHLFCFMFICTRNTYSNSVGVLLIIIFWLFESTNVCKWTSNGGTAFIFGTWLEHAYQHPQRKREREKKVGDGENERIYIWQRCVCVCVRKRSMCQKNGACVRVHWMLQIQIFYSFLKSLVD